MNYNSYLSSRHWKEKRLEALGSRGSKCEVCSATEQLNVHHSGYTDGKGDLVFWNENVKYLYILCARCHGLWHKYNDNIRITPLYKRRAKKILKWTRSVDDAIRYCTQREIYRIIGLEYTADRRKLLKIKQIAALRRLYRENGGSVNTTNIRVEKEIIRLLMKDTDVTVKEINDTKSMVEQSMLLERRER